MLLPQSNVEAEKDLDSFHLSATEKLEVTAFRRKDTDHDFVQLEELAQTTSNAGIQYLMLDTSDLVACVLCSKNLRPEIVPLLLERLLSGATSPLTSSPYSALKNLILSPVIVNDVKLFKQVWVTIINSKHVESVDTPLRRVNLLTEVLSKYSICVNKNRNDMSIETLLFILIYINKQDDSNFSMVVNLLRQQTLNERREEIAIWVKEKMPDCIDLPLSWTLEVADLYL
jgi:hypothetical protein